MFVDKKDHLSESHAQHSAVRKARFWSKVGAFVVGCFVLWFFYSLSKPLLYSREDRQALELLKEYESRSEVIKNPYERARYLSELRRERERIEGKYPIPSLYGLLFYRGEKKPLFLFLALLPFLLFLGLFLYLKKFLWPKWDRFFLPVPEQESPLVLPKKGLTLWGNSPLEKEFFTDAESFKKVFAYAEGLPEKEVSKEIESILKDAKDLIRQFYYDIDLERTTFCFKVVLWHYCASLYANLPTGLLSRYVKDYGLKKLLSLYARNHLPAFLDVTGKFLEEEYSAYVLCRLFYECDQVLHMRERLKKFSPLPFELNY